ncbi:MAG: TrmH family RNA methyltransferase [Bacteroidia bacterium]
MPSAAKLKLYASLRMSKYRQKYGLFAVEGRKVVDEVIHSGCRLEALLASESYASRQGLTSAFEIIPDAEMKRLSQFDTTPGVMAVLDLKPQADWNAKAPLTLAVDGLSDPGNLGTLIRLADWYGLSQIVASHDTVDAYNAKCIAASMGSFLRVDVVYCDLIETFQDARVFGAFLEGTALYETPFEDPCVLLIGSESHGIRQAEGLTRLHRFTIPQWGQAESLNAAMAAGISLDNAVRRLRENGVPDFALPLSK